MASDPKVVRKTAKPRAPKAAAKRAAPRTTAARSTRMRADASVDAYLARVPPAQRAALERLRAQIHAAAPGATEKISWGMPTFALDGRMLVGIAAFREHLSFFPGRAGVTLALREKLEGYGTAKGTIRFAPEKPIPATLVRKIVKMRVAEERAHLARRTAKRAAKKPARKPAKKA